jgi:tetratricopeptide (TPR) repeat protein
MAHSEKIQIVAQDKWRGSLAVGQALSLALCLVFLLALTSCAAKTAGTGLVAKQGGAEAAGAPRTVKSKYRLRSGVDGEQAAAPLPAAETPEADRLVSHAPAVELTPVSPPATETSITAPRRAGGKSQLGSFLAGRHAQFSGDASAAADFYLKALTVDPDNQSLRKRAMGLSVAAGKYESAFSLAEDVVADEPKQELARILLALRDFEAENYKSAAEQLAKADTGEGGWIVAPLLDAWISVGNGECDQALKKMGQLSQSGALASFYLYHRALIAEFVGRVVETDAAFAAIAKNNGGRSPRMIEARARFLARQGRAKEALAAIDAFLDAAPENVVLKHLRAEIAGVTKPAAMVASPQSGVAEALLAAASAVDRRQATEAVDIYLRLALFLRPDFGIAQMAMADQFEFESRWQDALDIYRKVDRESPYNLEAQIRISRALDEMGRTDEALAALEVVANQDPSKPDARIAQGDLLRAKERFEEAAVRYSEGIAVLAPVEKRHWSIFFARGIAYERSKQWAQAEGDLLRALDLNPDQPSVLNYLGYSWIDQGLKIPEGRRMIERAVQLKPNDGYFVDSLGWVFFRLGNYAAAVEQLERAVELKSDDPIINDHLGDAYWQVGRRNEARFQWERALGFKPEANLIPAIKRKLQEGLEPPAPIKGGSVNSGRS